MTSARRAYATDLDAEWRAARPAHPSSQAGWPSGHP